MRQGRNDRYDPTMSTSGGHDDRLAWAAGEITRWFPTSARDLPWRRVRTPWRALVSEFMLQQTQVSRVVERFEPFVDAFPSPLAMVQAGEDAVWQMEWDGLLPRARMLHAAALAIVEQHDGVVPEDAATLETLPGVGRYTAGAIASIACGENVPIVDGNVDRVFARLTGDASLPGAKGRDARRWKEAGVYVAAADRPEVANEGLMELGALVCQPKAAQCLICPLAAQCCALEAGKVSEIPPPKPRPKKKLVEMQVGVSWSGKKLLLARRPDSGLFAKTMFPPEAESFPSSEEGRPLGEVRHQTTHRDVRVQVFAFPDRCKVSGAEWKHPDDPQLALTSLASKIIALARRDQEDDSGESASS